MGARDLVQLERSLESAAHRVAPPEQHGAASAAGRGRRRRVVRRVTGTVGALALASGVIVPLALLSPLGGEPVRPPVTGPSSAPPPDLSARVEANIRVGPAPADITFSEGAVWVSLRQQGPGSDDSLVRVDVAINEIEDSLTVPEVPLSLSPGDGRVWAAWSEGPSPDYSHSLVSVDPTTMNIGSVFPGVRAPLAVGWESVWATEGEADAATATLVRIDQTSGKIVARIPLPVAPWHIAIGEEAVWILPLHADYSLIKIDPRTNEIVATVKVPEAGFVGSPVAGLGRLWIPVSGRGGGQAMVALDERTLEFRRAVSIQGSAPFGVSLGRVWILDEEGAVHGLNVSSLQIDVSVMLDQPPAQTAIAPSAVLDSEGDTIWVAKYQDEIARIELRASR